MRAKRVGMDGGNDGGNDVRGAGEDKFRMGEQLGDGGLSLDPVALDAIIIPRIMGSM